MQENNEGNFIKINLKDKIVTLKILDGGLTIDADEITQIDYHNVLGEILTFSVIMNRLGNLKADLEELLSIAKLESEMKKAELGEYYRKQLTKRDKDDNGNVKKVILPTIAEVDNAILLDKVYQNTRHKVFRLTKEYNYLDSLYWAAKSKDDKLIKISEKLKPTEFESEILEGVINGIMIKKHEKLIK